MKGRGEEKEGITTKQLIKIKQMTKGRHRDNKTCLYREEEATGSNPEDAQGRERK